jgi:hypothetical protein
MSVKTSQAAASDLAWVALRLLDQSGGMTTPTLIAALAEVFRPTGRDAEIMPAPRCDTFFSQKVRNLISRRHMRNNFIYNGYASYYAGRLRITEKGRALRRRCGP